MPGPLKKGRAKKSEQKSYFYGRKPVNRRLKDREIFFELKEPWNILTFPDDILKQKTSESGRSPRNNFYKNTEKSLWWLRLLLERTYFEEQLAA